MDFRDQHINRRSINGVMNHATIISGIQHYIYDYYLDDNGNKIYVYDGSRVRVDAFDILLAGNTGDWQADFRKILIQNHLAEGQYAESVSEKADFRKILIQNHLAEGSRR